MLERLQNGDVRKEPFAWRWLPHCGITLYPGTRRAELRICPCSSTGESGGLLSRKSWFESRQGYNGGATGVQRWMASPCAFRYGHLRRYKQGRNVVQQRRDGGEPLLPRSPGKRGQEFPCGAGARLLDNAGGSVGRHLCDILPAPGGPGAVARAQRPRYESASSMWGRRSSIVRYIQSK